MAAPNVRIYDISAAGNGSLANLTVIPGGQGGPQATLVSGPLSHGNVLGGEWKIKTICIALDGTADNFGFWIYDHTSDVGVVTNYNFFDSGQPWNFRARVSKQWLTGSLDPTSGDWIDLPYGSLATPWDLSAAILAAPHGGGPNQDAGQLVDATNVSGWKVMNSFIYIAMRPNVAAPAGDHNNWSYRLTAVYP